MKCVRERKWSWWSRSANVMCRRTQVCGSTHLWWRGLGGQCLRGKQNCPRHYVCERKKTVLCVLFPQIWCAVVQKRLGTYLWWRGLGCECQRERKRKLSCRSLSADVMCRRTKYVGTHLWWRGLGGKCVRERDKESSWQPVWREKENSERSRKPFREFGLAI